LALSFSLFDHSFGSSSVACKMAPSFARSIRTVCQSQPLPKCQDQTSQPMEMAGFRKLIDLNVVTCIRIITNTLNPILEFFNTGQSLIAASYSNA